MSTEADAIAQANSLVVDEVVEPAVQDTNVVVEEVVVAAVPPPSWDERLVDARAAFDNADIALEKARDGTSEVRISIATAETKLQTLRNSLSTKETSEGTAKKTAMDASEGVEAMHREYRRDLA